MGQYSSTSPRNVGSVVTMPTTRTTRGPARRTMMLSSVAKPETIFLRMAKGTPIIMIFFRTTLLPWYLRG